MRWPALNALHARSLGREGDGSDQRDVGAGDMTMQDYVDALKSGLVPGARKLGCRCSRWGRRWR